MIKKWPIHTVLLGLFPILFLYQHNLNEMFAVEIVDPIISIIFAAIVLTALFGALHRSLARGGLLASTLLVFFLSFGQLAELLPKRPPKDITSLVNPLEIYLLIALIAIFLILWFLVWRTKSKLPVVTALLNLISIVLVVISVGQISYAHLTREKGELTEQTTPNVHDNIEIKHDIYHIVLDGYARADILKRVFDYDNRPMISQLEELDFYVASKAHSNYAQTQLSVASMLNMNYVDSLFVASKTAGYRNQLARIVADNAIFNLLKRFGYNTATFASGYAYTRIRNVDQYFEPAVTTSEFQNLLVNITPIPIFLSKETNLFSLHRNRVNYILDKLPETYELEPPKYIYAHIVCPHPPFVFGENGQPTERDWLQFAFADGTDYFEHGGTVEEYKRGYIYQLEYINKRLIEVVKEIIDESETEPIILIHGDHGSGVGLDWTTKDQTDMEERFGILLAARLPGYPQERFPRNLTLVNLYRMIFRHYFDIDYAPLQNRSYFSTMKQPFDYNDVTDSLAQ